MRGNAQHYQQPTATTMTSSDYYTPTLPIDEPYEAFLVQLTGRRWPSSDLIEAREQLTNRLEMINNQLSSPDNRDRGVSWRTSTETARKYFNKKLAALNRVIGVEPQPKKAAGGYGFLVTFLMGGDHVVVATTRNPAELWADMIAEEETPPALIAFLNLTEAAAKKLPESIWVDDL